MIVVLPGLAWAVTYGTRRRFRADGVPHSLLGERATQGFDGIDAKPHGEGSEWT